MKSMLNTLNRLKHVAILKKKKKDTVRLGKTTETEEQVIKI